MVLFFITRVKYIVCSNLLSNGRNQETATVSKGSNGSFLLPLVQHLESVLGEWLSRLWHNINHIKDEDAATAGDVFPKAND